MGVEKFTFMHLRRGDERLILHRNYKEECYEKSFAFYVAFAPDRMQ